jgi:hypothetical protein
MTRAELRRLKYNQLVRSGFNEKYATRFRDFNQSLVDELCVIRADAQKKIDALEQAVLERIQDLLYRKGKRL